MKLLKDFGHPKGYAIAFKAGVIVNTCITTRLLAINGPILFSTMGISF
jgi:hypothetical protein